MIFVAISGAVNIGLDYLLIGPLDMHAAGAAVATVASQALSVVLSLAFLVKNNKELGVRRSSFRFDRQIVKELLNIDRKSVV